MSIIGFNYTKMSAEKKKGAQGSLKIQNNAQITNVKASSIELGGKATKALAVEFKYTVTYDPSVAVIELLGHVIYTDDEKKLKGVQDEWKKDKKVGESFGAPILNHVLAKSTIQALIMSKELNLPPPVKLPRVALKK